MSRDLADVALLYKYIAYLGIRLFTVAEGLVTRLHVGLKGTMNALHLKDLAQKTRKERELAEVRRKLDGLIAAIADGLRGPGLQQKLDDLEARKATLEEALAADPPLTVRVHPNLAHVYRAKVQRLHLALGDPALRDEALACCAV